MNMHLGAYLPRALVHEYSFKFIKILLDFCRIIAYNIIVRLRERRRGKAT